MGRRYSRLELERLEDRLCLAAPPAYPGAPFQLPQSGAWTSSPFTASPIFADLNGDGRDELITPIAGGSLAAYQTDAQGAIQLFQTYRTGSQANIASTPIVLNLPGGGKGIFAALGRDQGQPGRLEDGRLFGWDALSGAVLPGWPKDSGSSPVNNNQSGVTGPLAAGDLDGDLVPEIVVTSFSHYVTAYKLDGTMLWRFQNDETVEAGAVVGDIDRDGRNEVVFTSGMSPNGFFPAGGLINILNANGSSRHRIHVGELFFAAPILADLTGDGYLEIIAAPAPHFASSSLSGIPSIPSALAAGNRIYAYNYKGELLPGWPYKTTNDDSTYHQVWKEMAAADIDGNGTIEVIAIDAGGIQPPGINAPDPRLHVVQANGSALPGWEGGRSAMPPPQVTQFTSWASPIVVDVNGDGLQDIVVSYGAFLLAFDRQGNQLFWEVVGPPGASLPDGRGNAAAVGQFDGRGGLELVTVSNNATPPGRPNMVSIYGLPVSSAKPAWPMHRRTPSGDAALRSRGHLADFVEDASRALLGRSLPVDQTQGFVNSLLAGQYSSFLFARLLANGPEARGKVVDDLYQRFLGRAPSPSERANWIRQLETTQEYMLARNLAKSAEFLNRGAVQGGLNGQVGLLMKAIFPWGVTPAGINAWTSVIQGGWITYDQFVDSLTVSDMAVVRRFLPIFAAIGKPFNADNVTAIEHSLKQLGIKESDIAADVIASGGYYGATHELTRWVRTLWRDLLGREGNPLETAYIVRIIETGQTNPTSLARLVLNSEEARRFFVVEQYRRFLGREPSTAEVDARWNYTDRGDVVATLVASNEYYQKNGNTPASFVRAAFRDIAYFNPSTISQQTVDDWVRQLNSGTPRSELAATLWRLEAVPEQFFKYLPDESLGVLRTGPLLPTAPGQPMNPNPGAVAWLESVVRSSGRLEDAIVILVTSPQYFANASYWKGLYRNRGWRT